MGLPSIGGKDSTSGSFEQMDVPPTLVSFAVAVTKASKTVSAAFQHAGSRVVLLPIPEDAKTLLPDWERLKTFYKQIGEKMADGSILSASVDEGGAAAAVAKMCFGNGIGFDFDTVDEGILFAPLSGSLWLNWQKACRSPIQLRCLGKTIEPSAIQIGGEVLPLQKLAERWMGTLEKIFPESCPSGGNAKEVPLYTARYAQTPAIKAAKPRVFIPVFPGTNCEYDTVRAFEKQEQKPMCWLCAICARLTLKIPSSGWKKPSAMRKLSCCPVVSPAATSRTALESLLR